MAELTPLDREIRSPFHEYIDKAERYLEEGKNYSNDEQYDRAELLILGSIAASLIALAKKQ